MLKIILIILAAVLALLIIAAVILAVSLSGNVKDLRRVDEKGCLYYAEYTGNYYDGIKSLPVAFLRGGGCTAFVTRGEDGRVLTCRNYDLAHRDKSDGPTGLNVILRLNPEGKYSSLNVTDAVWMTKINIPYYSGSLDSGRVPIWPLSFLPYLCMDGMNEKGLTASILYLDIKPGETAVLQKTKGKKKAAITQLLRYVLDDCANVGEAIEYVKGFNLVNTVGNDYHLFITDASGVSAVLEWRHNTFRAVFTDAVTNFYVGDDDAEDCRYGEDLKERFPGRLRTVREYRWGYGHGYGRFNTVVSGLEAHRGEDGLGTRMSPGEASALLGSVRQRFDGSLLTSLTQYSAVYCNSDLSLSLRCLPEYETEYCYKL